jgi:acyl carrier protein
MSEALTLDAVIALLREVQPGLEGQEITAEMSIVDDLGLDSLDMLQLSRRISRDYDLDLDLDAWSDRADEHKNTVGSLLDFLAAESPA